MSSARWRRWLTAASENWRSMCRGAYGGYAAAMDLVVPPLCAVCHRGLPAASHEPWLCAACRESLISAEEQCRRCGTPLAPLAWDREACAACRNRVLHFASAVALGGYRGPLREAVLRSKRLAEEPLARALGGLLAQICRERWPDWSQLLIVPVPMHWRRRWRRGGNSAEVIADAVSRELYVPIDAGLLKYRRATAKQGTLGPQERPGNVRNAFAVKRHRRLAGRSVLLVDDVMTSGATASEIARTLRRSGVASVRVAVLARGLRSR